MKIIKNIVITTIVVLFIFLPIWALTDFSEVVLALGSVGVIVVIAGASWVLILADRRKALRKKIDDFRDERSKSWKDGLSKMDFPYYCPSCPYRAYEYAKTCPACGEGELKKLKK
jgi:hypothetical protein